MNPARIAELTVVEFKNLVREAVTESFADLLGDPDEGLVLRDGFAEELGRFFGGNQRGRKNVGPVRGCGQIQIGPISLHWTITLAMSRCVV